MKKSVLIIGGGIGGLTCGAILAKEGYHVHVIEKHSIIGGGLHTFKRYGLEFETGMHVISGFQEGGFLNKLFGYLGILDKLHIKHEDKDGFDYFHVDSDNITYKLAAGRQNFIDTLSAYFPDERENIERYIEGVYKLYDAVPILDLQMPPENGLAHLQSMELSIGDFLNSFTKNEKLQAILGWNNALYGGDKQKTPAYLSAMITKFYIEGAARFVGGSQQLADALAEIITKNGGQISIGNGVKFIDIQDKKIQKIVTENGQEFTADWYISAIHTSTMFNLMDTSKIQKSYYQRIDNIPNSYSSFTMFVLFKPNSFPYINHTCYKIPDYEATWTPANYTDNDWPRGIMYLTPPITDNDVFAKKMIVNAVMRYDTVKQWENTTVEQRGEDYKAFKKDCEERMLTILENSYPGFRSKIDRVFSATPLTIRDFYGVKEGAIYGTIQDCRNMATTHIAVRTKLSNLLLTGQNINFHGILGVPLTAVLTCSELTGLKNLLDKINE